MSTLIDIDYLFKTYYKRLFRVAYQVVSDTEIAEDIVQEVFIQIWKKSEDLNITSTIEGYLVKSTVNKSLNYLEKNKRKLTVEISENKEIIQNLSFEGEDHFDQQIIQELVQESLDKLPPKCKAIFVLSRFENLKNKEIAEQLNISVKTVENQMTIALNKLNAELKPKLNHLFPDFYLIILIFLNIS